MSSSRDRQLQVARDIDRVSTVLINAGVSTVKKNPIKFSLYIVGVALCLFFNGVKLSVGQVQNLDAGLNEINYQHIEELRHQAEIARFQYHRSRGWFFGCDTICMNNKRKTQEAESMFLTAKKLEDEKLANVKAQVGVFSEYGVDEARDLFWQRFSQGKSFATRQSKWDAIFMMFGSMTRDENIFQYILRLLINVLINFTLGVVGAVIAFLWGLYGLIVSYRENIFSAFAFFILAGLAAVSFALSWLFMLYCATAGTVFVGAKLVASNLRVQDGGAHERGRVRYN
jgi:hypothetical protein